MTNSASQYVKFGGCLGFSIIFLLVLLKNRDIVGAVMDASIACVVMAFMFKQLYLYKTSLERKVKESKIAEASKSAEQKEDSHRESLTDSKAEA